MRLLFLVLVGCAGTAPTFDEHRPVCVPGDATIDADVFARLTANRWGICDTNNGLCLSLSASGDFSTIEGFDDYAITNSGRWNFLARDATSGLVCFDDGSMLDFELTDAGLMWRINGLLPALDPQDPTGSRDALDAIPTPDLFTTLTEHAWQRANDLDLFYQPTSFAIARDGTWDAAWRDGACTATGTLSIVTSEPRFTGTTHTFVAHPAPNTCDTRRGGSTAYIPPTDDYGDPALAGDAQFLTFGPSSPQDGLSVRASWDQPLRADTTKEWMLTLTNGASRVFTLQSIQITLTPVADTGNGFTATGDTTTLVDETLAEPIASQDAFTTTASLALPAPGLYSLVISTAAMDGSLPRPLYRSYVLELTP